MISLTHLSCAKQLKISLEHQAAPSQGMRLFLVVTIYRAAITSISSSTPRGKDLTATVERAGL
jgi:hypothetical protein